MSLRRIALLTFALATLILTDSGIAATLVDEIYRERQKNSDINVDVTRIATVHIAINTEVALARRILEASKFMIYETEKKGGSYTLVGTQKRMTLPRFMPFLEDEYRIVLGIREGKVESVRAWIFLQTL